MTHQKFLRAKTVMEITGYSRIQLWRKSRNADDDFPAPVQLSPGKGAIGWYQDEIDAWIASRPRVSYAPEPEAAARDGTIARPMAFRTIPELSVPPKETPPTQSESAGLFSFKRTVDG